MQRNEEIPRTCDSCCSNGLLSSFGRLLKVHSNEQRLAIRHFLGHVKKELTIGLIGLAEQPPKLVEVASVFARTTPRNVIRRFSPWKVRQFWWFLAVVEQLIEWALKSTGELFQGFDGRDSVARSLRGKYSNEAGQNAFQCRPGRVSFPHALRAGGRQ